MITYVRMHKLRHTACTHIVTCISMCSCTAFLVDNLSITGHVCTSVKACVFTHTVHIVNTSSLVHVVTIHL